MKKTIAIIIMLILVIIMGIVVYNDSKTYQDKTVVKSEEKENNSLVIEENKEENTENKQEEIKEDITTKEVINNEEKVEEISSSEQITKPVEEEPTIEQPIQEEPVVEPIIDEVVYTEPVSYFQNEVRVIELSKKNDSSLKEKAKKTFIDIIDFIFYEKEIKGYRFSDLTQEAKLTVIEAALDIDKLIDSKFPDYKDNIKENYENIKGKLGVKFLEVSANICDTMGEEKCNLAKESFSHLKKSLSFTIELVKELAKSGSQRIKTLYEKFRG